jgi:hypothetical protein
LDEFIEMSQRLPEGFWGNCNQDQIKKLWKWPAGRFDVNAKNIDVQFNMALLQECDPEHDQKHRVRLVRHFYNLPSLSRKDLVQLAGTSLAAIDWDSIGDYRHTGHQALQLALTRYTGGVAFESKELRTTTLEPSVWAQPVAEGVDVDGLISWLQANGDADCADRSVCATFWLKEMQLPDSKLKTLKALGMSKEDMRGCIIDHQSKGAKGSEEILSFDLEFEDFDLERLPWLAKLIEHFKRDRTQAPVMMGPRKCGKSQFLMALCAWVSAQDKAAKIVKCEP